ncbi:hypothetical protein [Legionella worsleiensis]|uniref:Uncharacterized protein n=1 Tax=Legionella worsleiensis TaxID=45076 RepID=A0A0W1A3H9_9GAMM|nr:hypothetical protein [Legionella worsleiensis]KTD75903.1 hypothetical protein Lwor_2469 [Legionella worsleiensis]STY32916.1 Uncharacterised protein [Legionella worsleiensis]
MSRLFTTGFLTGSHKATENRLMGDLLLPRQRRTVGQMFFEPYESREEFVYCARHTFIPMAMIGLCVLVPATLIVYPAMVIGFSALSATVGAISDLCGDDVSGSFFLNLSKTIIVSLGQLIIDLFLLPLTAVAMLTRSISTGLHMAGISSESSEALSPGM